MNQMYSEKVMKHFLHPHNYGKIKNADGVGRVGNVLCGDVMHVYIKVKNDRIVDIKFETFGCAAALATSSMVTDLAKGKTIKEALKIGREDVSDALGGLPKIKIHCSNLAAQALHEAIYNYLKRKKLPIPQTLEEEHKRVTSDLDTIEHRHKLTKKA